MGKPPFITMPAHNSGAFASAFAQSYNPTSVSPSFNRPTLPRHGGNSRMAGTEAHAYSTSYMPTRPHRERSTPHRDPSASMSVGDFASQSRALESTGRVPARMEGPPMDQIPAVFIPAAPVALEPVEYAVPAPPGMDDIHRRDQEAADAMIQSAWRDMQASKAMQQHWQTTHGIQMPSSLPRTSLNQQAPRANSMDPGWMKEAKQVGQLSRAANDPSFYPGAAYGHGGGFYGGLYGGGSRSQYHGGAAAQNMRMAEQQLRYGSGQGF